LLKYQKAGNNKPGKESQLMRKRVPTLVITFATTTKAMKMEDCCKKADAPGRIIPIPGEITAGCGLAWSARPEDRAALEKVLSDNELEAEGFFEIMF
jgi:hypothetical protein